MSDKQIISDWQEKVRSTYGEEAMLFQYLFETMDNFYYRYLETTTCKNLTTEKLSDHLWGVRSYETNMAEALKIQNESVRKSIIEMAKAVPKTKSPKVDYELLAQIKELTAGQGSIDFKATIAWAHADHKSDFCQFSKSVNFKYSDLAQFRKELALKLEEVCEIFL